MSPCFLKPWSEGQDWWRGTGEAPVLAVGSGLPREAAHTQGQPSPGVVHPPTIMMASYEADCALEKEGVVSRLQEGVRGPRVIKKGGVSHVPTWPLRP